jgi:hypothetical protein
MPLYTFYYKKDGPTTRSLGTMIDYMPIEVMSANREDGDSFSLSNMVFWNIAASQSIQSKLEALKQENDALLARVEALEDLLATKE